MGPLVNFNKIKRLAKIISKIKVSLEIKQNSKVMKIGLLK